MTASALVALPLVFAVIVLLPIARRRSRAVAVAAGVFVAGAALAAFAVPVRSGVHAAWAPTLGLTYAVDVDALSAMFIAVVGIVFSVGAASSERIGHGRAYFALLCVALATITGTLVARDLGLFFVFWEAMFACLALLVAHWGGDGRTDASLRLVLTALVGSALYLVVIVSLAAVRGSLDLDALRARPLPATGQLGPAVLLSAAFLLTMPLFPLHAWLVRALVAAPRAVAIVLAACVPSVALYALVRFCVGIFPQGVASAAPAFVALAAVGTVYGALLAARQDDARRLLAFASLSSIDLAAIGVFAGTDLGIRGALLATISRALIVASLLVLAAQLARRAGSPAIARAGGLAASSPTLAAVATFAVLAAVGIPGTSAFAADYLVLVGSAERFPIATGVAAFVLVASAVWGARFLRRALGGPPLARGPDLSWRERALVLPLLLLVVAIGAAPRALTDRIPADAIPTLESPR